MSNIIIRRVEPTEAQIDEAANLCVRAFKGDIAIISMVGANEDLVFPLFRSMIKAGILTGELYVATNSDEEIIGTSLWLGPGHNLWETEEQRNLGFTQVFAQFSEETQRWWKEVYELEFEQFLRGSLGPQGSTDAFYANLIATDPKFQRQGIATKMVRLVCGQASKANNYIALCSANDLNSSIYQKMGLQIRGQCILSGPQGQFPSTCFTS